MTIAVFGKAFEISLVSAIWSMPGMIQSLTRTSGFSSMDFSNASELVLASPQISQPACPSNRTRRILRVPSWSSAINILAMMHPFK
jgi:hypothetical protein